MSTPSTAPSASTTTAAVRTAPLPNGAAAAAPVSALPLMIAFPKLACSFWAGAVCVLAAACPAGCCTAVLAAAPLQNGRSVVELGKLHVATLPAPQLNACTSSAHVGPETAGGAVTTTVLRPPPPPPPAAPLFFFSPPRAPPPIYPHHRRPRQLKPPVAPHPRRHLYCHYCCCHRQASPRRYTPTTASP